MLKSLTFLLGFIFLISCESNNTQDFSFTPDEIAYTAEPNANNAAKLMQSYNVYINENRGDAELIIPVLEKAYDVAAEHRPPATANYLAGLIRVTPIENSKFPEYLYEMGNVLKKQGKSDASDIMLTSLVKTYPDFEKSGELQNEISGRNPQDVIDSLAEARLQNTDEFGLNKEASFNYVDACEAFAYAYPDHPQTPEYIFNAAEMAKLLKTTNKALNLYDWLIFNYPEYKRTPSALFIKAFVLENELNNLDMARLAYEEFLEKYPNDDFADDARFSLENLGKSPDEVLKIIEQKNAEQ